jgi:aldose 1-epimerase
MKISSIPFGKTKKGIEVFEYTMTNDLGASVSILNLGGIISKIQVPDSKGNLANVVIGFDTVKAYEKCTGFVGAAIGRSAGRISNANLCIDQRDYPLAKNDGNNNLHGGPNALDKAIWSVSEFQDKNKMSLILHYTSPDMEEGFPGQLDCNINYSFTNENALTIRYSCTTDKKTFVNMTNHSYFNLSGDLSTKITDHLLQIKADQLIAVHEDTIPKAIVSVEGTAFDFRSPKAIGQDIDANEEQILFGKGYDHAFELNPNCQGPNIIAEDPKTGRIMEVTTDAKCLVFYSGNFLSDSDHANADIALHPRAAFCLETQYYPDSINADFIESKFLEPDQIYRTTTTFKFK